MTMINLPGSFTPGEPLTISLYQHQEYAVSKVVKLWDSPKRRGWRCVGVSPTGSGKTHIFYNIVLRTSVPGRTLILVHTKELLYQHYERIEQHYGDHFGSEGLVGDGIWDPYADVVIATVQTLVREPERIRQLCEIGRIGKIIIDETHRAVCDMHQAVVSGVSKYNPEVRVLGVTATHDRRDERGLREVFDETAFVIQPEYLARHNYIARPFYVSVLETSPGNFYQKWRKYCDGQKMIIFAVTKAEAIAYARYFGLMGVKSGWILDETENEERERVKTECRVITNCSTMIEGTDIDGVRAVALQSVSLENRLNYVQKAGRAMRVVRDENGNPLPTQATIIGPAHHNLLAKLPKDVLGKVKKKHEVEETIPPRREKPQWYLNGVKRGYWD